MAARYSQLASEFSPEAYGVGREVRPIPLQIKSAQCGPMGANVR